MLDLGDISWDESTLHWRSSKQIATDAFGDLVVEFRDFAQSGVESQHHTTIESFLQNQGQIAAEIKRLMPEEAELELVDQFPNADILPDFNWTLASILQVDIKTRKLKLYADVSWDDEHLWEIEIDGSKIVGIGRM